MREVGRKMERVTKKRKRQYIIIPLYINRFLCIKVVVERERERERYTHTYMQTDRLR